MRKSNIVVLITTILLIPLLATSAVADEITATRDISEQTVNPGDVFNVEIVLTAVEDLQAPALDEDLPDGWVVTPVDDSFGTYKDTTNEWVWSAALAAGKSITINYNVTVPTCAVAGCYNITGVVSAHEVGPFVTGGENTVTIPGVVPTEEPTEKPTEEPTEKPTEEPTEKPTEKPTEEPTKKPAEEPTKKPTPEPTEIPEFPMIAIPVITILGMMFLLSRRK
jgi:hypothetical protein